MVTQAGPAGCSVCLWLCKHRKALVEVGQGKEGLVWLENVAAAEPGGTQPERSRSTGSSGLGEQHCTARAPSRVQSRAVGRGGAGPHTASSQWPPARCE